MIIVDTGFLSSLLKIKREELILKVFEIENIFVPVQVLRELEKTAFFDSVAHLFSYSKDKESWIQVIPVEIKEDEEFGQGELACIRLAKEEDAILLIDDKKAMQKANEEGITTLNLAGFLVLCRELKLLTIEELRAVLVDLKKRDYYLFSKENQHLILDE